MPENPTEDNSTAKVLTIQQVSHKTSETVLHVYRPWANKKIGIVFLIWGKSKWTKHNRNSMDAKPRCTILSFICWFHLQLKYFSKLPFLLIFLWFSRWNKHRTYIRTDTVLSNPRTRKWCRHQEPNVRKDTTSPSRHSKRQESIQRHHHDERIRRIFSSLQSLSISTESYHCLSSLASLPFHLPHQDFPQNTITKAPHAAHLSLFFLPNHTVYHIHTQPVNAATPTWSVKRKLHSVHINR